MTFFKKGNTFAKLGKGHLGKKHSKKTRRRIGEITRRALANPEIREKMRIVQLGKKLSEETKAKIRASAPRGDDNPARRDDVRKKISAKLKGRKITWGNKIREALRGRNMGPMCRFWKGGITSENERIRTGIDFRLWREAVFARDNWTCQKCGKKGGKLEAHHIKRFSLYPELRFAIDNGITLCVNCHKKTDNYGNRKDRKK